MLNIKSTKRRSAKTDGAACAEHLVLSGVLAQLNLLGQARAGVHQAVHNTRHREDSSDDGAGRRDKVVPVPGHGCLSACMQGSGGNIQGLPATMPTTVKPP